MPSLFDGRFTMKKPCNANNIGIKNGRADLLARHFVTQACSFHYAAIVQGL
jgi:hypothetical protein